MNVQKLSRVLHRDVGYFISILTMLYCVSGIAVNHVDDWNPNHSSETREVEIGALSGSGLDEFESDVIAKLKLDAKGVTGRHLPSADTFKLFLPNGGEVVVNPSTGKGKITEITPRPFIFETNVLHLNHLKGVWTYVADAFALLLFGLALTGLLILKGPQGFWGRGKWFFGAGAALPVAFIVYYNLTR